MQVIQESVIEKAKKFVVNNKGELAALAGLAALGGAGYVVYNKGLFGNNSDQNNQNTDTFKPYEDPVKKQTIFKSDRSEIVKKLSDEMLQQSTEITTPEDLNKILQLSQK